MATTVCLRHGVYVTFEEVLPAGDCLGVNVVRGENIFSNGALPPAETTAPRKTPGNNARGPYKKRKTTQVEREGIQEMQSAMNNSQASGPTAADATASKRGPYKTKVSESNYCALF